MADSKDKGRKPGEGTEEYELGDDFLTDVDHADEDEDLDPETYERDALGEGETDDEAHEDDDADDADDADECRQANEQ